MPQQFTPLTPPVLALALELQRQSTAHPEIRLLDAVQAILDARPALDVQGVHGMTAQLNDLMALANPESGALRLALMVFLPDRRGSLFTLKNLPLIESKLMRHSPIQPVAAALAQALDASWPELLASIENIPTPMPLRVLGANGLPAEAHHPAAAGPQPGDVQQFLRP
jgi:hypothetical protein